DVYQRQGLGKAEAPTPARFQTGETAEERNARLATYVAVGAVVLVAGMSGTAVALRDARRRHKRRGEGGSWTRWPN
ncbi:hypothetical protein C1J00_25970, partial [Streptomyces cahuitamycinicus]